MVRKLINQTVNFKMKKMKNHILITLLILIGFTSNAQNTLPVEELINYSGNSNKGLTSENISYVKDVNGKLDKFEGTWRGDHMGKSYTITIFERTINYRTNPNIKKDELSLRYSITNSDGSLYATNMDFPDDSPWIVGGQYLYNDNTYYFDFYGDDQKCSLDGTLAALVSSDRISITLFGRGEMIAGEDCPKIREVFPDRKSIVLSKQ